MRRIALALQRHRLHHRTADCGVRLDPHEILFPITIFGVIASLLAPFFGSLADRYGVRPVALWSLLAFGVSFAAISLTPTAAASSTLYIYYALWLLVGLVGIGSTPVTWSRAINLWFFKNRGLALGILLLGTSLAAIVVPKLAVWAIETHGWRMMFAIVALLPLLVALPLGYFLFREPRADERPGDIAGASGRLTGVRLGTALKDYRFWLIWLCIALDRDGIRRGVHQHARHAGRSRAGGADGGQRDGRAGHRHPVRAD